MNHDTAFSKILYAILVFGLCVGGIGLLLLCFAVIAPIFHGENGDYLKFASAGIGMVGVGVVLSIPARLFYD